MEASYLYLLTVSSFPLFLQVLCFCATDSDSDWYCFIHELLQGQQQVSKHHLKPILVMGGSREQYGGVLS